jgi:AmpD protein
MKALMTIPTRLKVRTLPSPHHRGREGRSVDLIVIHAISCPPGHLGTKDIEDLFLGRLDCSRHHAYKEVRGKELSAHFLIDRAGSLTQFVETGRAAFHAGRSSWKGRRECNDFSVGIELVGDERPFTQKQYRTLARLCRDIIRLHPAITPEQIVGHSDIAPGRKTDPGPGFDWKFFRKLLGVRR